MDLFDCWFTPIKMKEDVKVGQGETINKTVIGYGYKEVSNQLKKIYGDIEVQSIQRRYEVHFLTPKVLYDIHYDICQDFREKIMENNKKQDDKLPNSKPSNIVYEDDEPKKKTFGGKINGKK